jgi:ABC-type dipeptide/oligopeptide/nickel transport system permease component
MPMAYFAGVFSKKSGKKVSAVIARRLYLINSSLPFVTTIALAIGLVLGVVSALNRNNCGPFIRFNLVSTMGMSTQLF